MEYSFRSQAEEFLRQTCKVCHRPDKFNFDVPDAVWEAVVPESYRKLVVCLSCFDDFAHERGVNYAPYIRLVYFVGDQANLHLATAKALAPIDGQWICCRLAES